LQAATSSLASGQRTLAGHRDPSAIPVSAPVADSIPRCVDPDWERKHRHAHLLTRINGRPTVGELVTGNDFSLLGVPAFRGRMPARFSQDA
jgi:hypothetical protein